MNGIAKSVSEVIKNLEAYSNGFCEIGKGIGAIFLLIVAFYYITSILDGGKFQLKMLLPLLIFLVVCNFSWISVPVTSFTDTLSSSLISTCNEVRNTQLKNSNFESTDNYADMYNKNNASKDDARLLEDKLNPDSDKDEYFKQVAKNYGGQAGYWSNKANESNPSSDGVSTNTESGTKAPPEPKGFGARAVKRGAMSAVNQVNYDIQQESASNTNAKAAIGSKNMGIWGLVNSICSVICEILGVVLGALGGIMTAIIVVFGPVTWAFAIFPGSGGTIKSWFIRLCQFALYAPICALINSFCTIIFTSFANRPAGGSVLFAIAIAMVNILCLTSVPSIASMIIEGAQGAVSLSQGLQTLTSAAGVAGSALAAGGKAGGAVIGKENLQALKDIKTGAQNMGVAGLAKGMKAGGFKGMMSRARANGRSTRLGRNKRV